MLVTLADLLIPVLPAATLTGNINADDLEGALSSPNVIVGNAGNDTIEGGRQVDYLFGGDRTGNNTSPITFPIPPLGSPALTDDDRIEGNKGDDFLYGETGNDLMDGGKGNDLLVGGFGNDTLLGGKGDDRLCGVGASGVGLVEVDTLKGGNGADTFVLGRTGYAFYRFGGNNNYALITDFQASEGDVIQVRTGCQAVSGNLTGGLPDTLIYKGSELIGVIQDKQLTPGFITAASAGFSVV
jgi:Ca2+-binding RTX toxin-like protein